MIGQCRWAVFSLLMLAHWWCCAQAQGDEAKAKTQPPDTERIQTWIRQLDNASFQTREAATRGLESAGREAIKPLGEALRGHNPEVTWRGIVALKEICVSGDVNTSDEAAAVLQRLSDGTNRSVAAAAARALQSWRRVRHQRAATEIARLGGRILLQGDTVYRLVLNENWQGDQDAMRLLTHLNGLSFLELHGEKFTDKDVRHLTKVTGLTRLNLYATAMTAKGDQALRAAAPDLTIFWFGNAVLGITGSDAPKGCRITGIYPDSGAQKAGIQANDVVTSLDGAPIKSFSELTRTLIAKKAGQSVEVELLRGEETMKLSVILGKRAQIMQGRVLFPPPPIVVPPRRR